MSTTTNYYFDAGGDGYMQYAFGTFDTCHDAANYTNNDAASVNNIAGTFVDSPVTNMYIRRGASPVDTSALPDTATITAATVYVKAHATAKYDSYSADARSYVSFVQSTQANGNSQTAADYSAISTTKITADMDIGTWTVNQWNTFAMNATGLSFISKTGYTKMCMLEGHDLEDTNFASPVAYNHSGVIFLSSDNTGTSSDPYIAVTYDTTSIKSWNGLAKASIKSINGLAIASVKEINDLA